MNDMNDRGEFKSEVLVDEDGFDAILPVPHWFSPSEKKRFRALRQNLWASIEPQNFIECSYGHEMAHLLWSIEDNHNRMASLIENAKDEGIIRLLTGRCDNLIELMMGVRRRDLDAIANLKAVFKDLDIDYADLNAQARSTIAEELSVIERDTAAKRDQFDRLAQNFEKRRFIIAERLRRLVEPMPPATPLLSLSGEEGEE